VAALTASRRGGGLRENTAPYSTRFARRLSANVVLSAREVLAHATTNPALREALWRANVGTVDRRTADCRGLDVPARW
jgi:hypothetical protein